MNDTQSNAYGVRHEVERYFERRAELILRELQAAASLTTHRQLYGLAGEESIRSFLKDLLPRRYGVGSGHIVSFDAASAQVDVVIYDSETCFKVPVSETATLFSIEGVYGAIEVKTSPSRSRNVQEPIEKAVANIKSIMEVVHPFPFSMTSKVPAFKDVADGALLAESGKHFVHLMYPVSAILLIGTASRFKTVMKHFRHAQEQVEHWHNRANLLCVVDEQNYGLCGYDYTIVEGEVVQRFWRERCESVGETLSTLLYWLVHKMTFERVIEHPLIHNPNTQAIWPSVIAPVVRRIHVDVNETGTQKSWLWPKETREFIE